MNNPELNHYIENPPTHIEAEIDDIHAQKLMELQAQLKQPLSEILALAIDSLASQCLQKREVNQPAPLYRVLEDIGFIGCIERDQQLSTTYKKRLDFSHKYGASE